MKHENEIQSAPSYTCNILYAGKLISQYSDVDFKRFNYMRELLEKECKGLIRENNFNLLEIKIYQYLWEVLNI